MQLETDSLPRSKASACYSASPADEELREPVQTLAPSPRSTPRSARGSLQHQQQQPAPDPRSSPANAGKQQPQPRLEETGASGFDSASSQPTPSRASARGQNGALASLGSSGSSWAREAVPGSPEPGAAPRRRSQAPTSPGPAAAPTHNGGPPLPFSASSRRDSGVGDAVRGGGFQLPPVHPSGSGRSTPAASSGGGAHQDPSRSFFSLNRVPSGGGGGGGSVGGLLSQRSSSGAGGLPGSGGASPATAAAAHRHRPAHHMHPPSRHPHPHQHLQTGTSRAGPVAHGRSGAIRSGSPHPPSTPARPSPGTLVRYFLTPLVLLPLIWPWMLLYGINFAMATTAVLCTAIADVVILAADMLRRHRRHPERVVAWGLRQLAWVVACYWDGLSQLHAAAEDAISAVLSVAAPLAASLLRACPPASRALETAGTVLAPVYGIFAAIYGAAVRWYCWIHDEIVPVALEMAERVPGVRGWLCRAVLGEEGEEHKMGM
ncbi:hypothetical protein HYH03_007739 [Edaphochlamys debaryana]|uniref:Uncharacterized protein n=1 Tax=Edaphochlamys debaryana TaxID=47281 RepID=A0A835Y1H1_9CHLO|nr:hypothetical protein HYH03_007739 [Edaphochlamys debaryana]|eukprot:KAG2494100.1 hypothetical protein HYH03_007739 [Edaphochlamys debaryana]